MPVINPIAYIHSDFPEKFGIPRQSGIVPGLQATIIFAPPYRNPDALRGIDTFSHLWLIWGFSDNKDRPFSPTVRPPRLGGNTRMGVFATRSPFRPNNLGLSAVRLKAVEDHPSYGKVLHILGGDLMDGTPIYDIKPYIPYADCHTGALGGFAHEPPDKKLTVLVSPEILDNIPKEKLKVLTQVLAQDPRPPYQQDPERVYTMAFGGFEIAFTVDNDTLTVQEIRQDLTPQ